MRGRERQTERQHYLSYDHVVHCGLLFQDDVIGTIPSKWFKLEVSPFGRIEDVLVRSTWDLTFFFTL